MSHIGLFLSLKNLLKCVHVNKPDSINANLNSKTQGSEKDSRFSRGREVNINVNSFARIQTLGGTERKKERKKERGRERGREREREKERKHIFAVSKIAESGGCA